MSRSFRLGRWRSTPPTLLRIYLLGGAIVLAVALLLYFNRLAQRVDSQTEAMSALTARLIAFTTLTVGESPDSLTQRQFQNAIQSLTFPVILTDITGRPVAWSSQVPVARMGIDQLIREDLENPSREMEKVLGLRDRMDRSHLPIPMLNPGTRDTLLYFHYGASALAGELRWIPWITIGVAALFGVVGLLMVRSFKRAEESYIWAGMAKESAHQMGTPLSSLAGWLHVLQEEVPEGGDKVTLSRELYEEVVREIGQDTGRLNRVAARFSQIGSRPRLDARDLGPVIQETVAYFHRRFPQGVSLRTEIAPDLPPADHNPELFGWVLENLIKNALNAVEIPGGEVKLVASAGDRSVIIDVIDNGKGVEPGMEKQVFRPGVSTRTRGWGLGLPLSRRIVEQYHGGRLELLRSSPGKGAVFRVSLPRREPGAP